MNGESFVGGFLVLGFVIFTAGFMAGMLAILMMPVSPELTTLEIMYFVLGLTIGVIATAAFLIVLKMRKKKR
ncbi:MAG: hypothetical protein QW667_01395 [Candidatus Bathyarchaeia archaeon]